MRVAAHVDQLFFSVPGGVGTYIRNLVPALAGREPSLELTLFHARFETPRPSEAWPERGWTGSPRRSSTARSGACTRGGT